MSERFLNDRVELHCGDCLDVLATLPENSLDSCVTDPPYHLTSIVERFQKPSAADLDESTARAGPYKRASRGFMGKVWDGGDIAFDPDTWRAVYRVLKPGAHLLAFGGTRTYHRMVCAIEDAGFEIRDTLAFMHGVGFPKSLDVSKRLDNAQERCTCNSHMRSMPDSLDSEESLSGGAKQDMLASMQWETDIAGQKRTDQKAANHLRSMRRDSKRPAADQTAQTTVGVLQPIVSRESTCGSSSTFLREHEGASAQGQALWSTESSVEGRGDVSASTRELRKRSLREMSAASDFDGEDGRLRDGASPSNGADSQTAIAADGMRASSRSPAIEQCTDQSGIMAVQSEPQERGAWDRCGRCGKPIVPDGLGTALKPACELIVLARKPLSEGTVAANVLKHGTGALNIDGCRVPGPPTTHGGPRRDGLFKGLQIGIEDFVEHAAGRWPANVVHDGSAEVLAGFPESESNGCDRVRATGNVYGEHKPTPFEGYYDSGSAARFFYTSKADADDRLGSRHPTVKPLDLMQWLVRLITPPKGIVLDCFAGTGTTGEAAWREGMRAVLIEAEAEYQTDIRRRMALALAGPDERSRESIKAKNLPRDDGPLFGGTDLQGGHVRKIYGEFDHDKTGKRYEKPKDDAPLFAHVNDYDATDDFARSIDEAYRVIRERKANGGKGWMPP